MIYSWFIIAFGIALLVLIINLPIPIMPKFILGLGAMFGISKLLASQTKIKEEWGLLLIRSKCGLKTIDKLSQYEKEWKFFADTGMAIAYGLLSFFIIKRPVKERAKVMFCGLTILTLLSILAAPIVFPFLIGTLQMEGLDAKANVKDQTLLIAAIMYLGGFALTVFISLISYSAVILFETVQSVVFGIKELGEIVPGATLILPGINIPFTEGVLALLLVLIVHEGAHAVFARIARIPILSSGIVLFGVIPIGAFVEPDEKKLKKLNVEKQNRILIAGSAANFFTALIVCFLFFAFLFLTAPYKEQGLLVVGGNESGTIIYKINGQGWREFIETTDNKTKFNQTFVFETDKGVYNGRLDRDLRYYDLSLSFFIVKYKNILFEMIYKILGFAFSLNFIIGVINLLPLPFFDGYRLLENNVNIKPITTLISWTAILAFLINFLPWFF